MIYMHIVLLFCKIQLYSKCATGLLSLEHQLNHCLLEVCDHFSHGVLLVDVSFAVTFGLCVE